MADWYSSSNMEGMPITTRVATDQTRTTKEAIDMNSNPELHILNKPHNQALMEEVDHNKEATVSYVSNASLVLFNDSQLVGTMWK